jgi:hypothetical protein
MRVTKRHQSFATESWTREAASGASGMSRNPRIVVADHAVTAFQIESDRAVDFVGRGRKTRSRQEDQQIVE